ncbi:hypothetical protein ACLVWQ_39325 [Streptomyces sp. CWNU-52B]|uniref:hypothetical protein n=1 Tax=unclassified Streptomyces TaxID=2593676 RepID=UPI0039BF9138
MPCGQALDENGLVAVAHGAEDVLAGDPVRLLCERQRGLDTFGNDLVRFMTLVVPRPSSSRAIPPAASSRPGCRRTPAGADPGALCEDAPFSTSGLIPAYGRSVRQGGGPLLELSGEEDQAYRPAGVLTLLTGGRPSSAVWHRRQL